MISRGTCWFPPLRASSARSHQLSGPRLAVDKRFAPPRPSIIPSPMMPAPSACSGVNQRAAAAAFVAHHTTGPGRVAYRPDCANRRRHTRRPRRLRLCVAQAVPEERLSSPSAASSSAWPSPQALIACCRRAVSSFVSSAGSMPCACERSAEGRANGRTEARSRCAHPVRRHARSDN